MILKISAALILLSLISAVFCGREEALISAFFGGGIDTVTYCLKVCGGICLFSGFMRVAEDSGLIKQVAKLLRPLVKYIMPSALVDEDTENSVVMNISSNLFGLGNAATPFGIKAAGNMYGLNRMTRPNRSFASFIVLNTSSLCLIPSTVITLRQSYGAADPADMILPVIIVQLISCAAGLLLVRAVFRE